MNRLRARRRGARRRIWISADPQGVEPAEPRPRKPSPASATTSGTWCAGGAFGAVFPLQPLRCRQSLSTVRPSFGAASSVLPLPCYMPSSAASPEQQSQSRRSVAFWRGLAHAVSPMLSSFKAASPQVTVRHPQRGLASAASGCQSPGWLPPVQRRKPSALSLPQRLLFFSAASPAQPILRGLSSAEYPPEQQRLDAAYLLGLFSDLLPHQCPISVRPLLCSVPVLPS